MLKHKNWNYFETLRKLSNGQLLHQHHLVRGQTKGYSKFLDGINRRTMVSPTINDLTIVYDEESEAQKLGVLRNLTSQLSTHFQCPALAVLNHDDDVLWYDLFDSGTLLDSYNSTPQFFDEEADSKPTGGDAALLCRLFQVPNSATRISEILAKPQQEYIFARDRHRDIATALNLPPLLIDTGFHYLETGKFDPELEEIEFVLTGDGFVPPEIEPIEWSEG